MNAVLQIADAPKREPRGVYLVSVKNTKPGAENKAVPDEPEQLRLWRAVIDYRDEVVKELKRWSRKNHPLRQELAKTEFIYGKHGRSERALNEMDENARNHAAKLREKIELLDRKIRVGTSETSKDDRGLSLKGLRELLPTPTATAAKHWTEQWLRNRDDSYTKRRAVEELQRLVMGRRILSADDLIEAERADREERTFQRRRNKSKMTGSFPEVARRIVEKLTK